MYAPDKFATALRIYCDTNNINAEEFAERIGVPRSTVYKWLEGVLPSKKRLLGVCRKIGITLTEISKLVRDDHSLTLPVLQRVYDMRLKQSPELACEAVGLAGVQVQLTLMRSGIRCDGTLSHTGIYVIRVLDTQPNRMITISGNTEYRMLVIWSSPIGVDSKQFEILTDDTVKQTIKTIHEH